MDDIIYYTKLESVGCYLYKYDVGFNSFKYVTSVEDAKDIEEVENDGVALEDTSEEWQNALSCEDRLKIIRMVFPPNY